MSFLLAAGNAKVPILGTTSLTLRVMNHTKNISAYVVENLPYPIILGMEFLCNEKSIINLQDNTIMLTGKVFELNKSFHVSQHTSYTQRRSVKGYNNTLVDIPKMTYYKQCVDDISQTLRAIIKRNNNTEMTQIRQKETMTQVNTIHDSLRDHKLLTRQDLDLQEQDTYETFAKANFDIFDTITSCNISTMKVQRNSYPCVTWLFNEQNKLNIRKIYSTDNKLNFTLNVASNYQMIWHVLKELKQIVTRKNITHMYLQKPAVNNTQIKVAEIIRMIYYIFKDTPINIYIFENSISTSEINSQDYNTVTVHQTSLCDSVSAQTSDQLQQTGDRNTHILKLCLSKDYKMDPHTKITVKLTLNGDVRDITLPHLSNNNKFLVKKGLILNVADDFTSGTLESRGHNALKLFKGTAVAYLEELVIDKPLFLINQLQTGQTKNREVKIDSKLSSQQNEAIKHLINSYSDIFADDLTEIGSTQLVEHKIQLTDSTPIKSKPYKVSPKERQIIEEQITEMLEQGVIRPSQSPYSSPIVLVKKKGEKEKVRFCVDYRKLNKVTKKSNYPLSNIDEILTYFGKSNFFSTLDLFSGFWQVGIEENSKEYTAFVTPGFGLFEFNKLPFGLCNAPSTFQDLTDRVFRGLKWSSVLVYLDDVIVFSETFEEHLDKLKEVFQRLRDANLTLKTQKCTFAATQVKVLGHIVNNNSIRPDPEKLGAIRDFPRPKTVRQLQSFLGLANYYRKFIANFSKLAHPLHKLLSKNFKFKWDTEQEDAFNVLKNKLCESPVLVHFNPHIGCELRADACKDGLGVILLQEYEGQMHPMAYASRSLTKAEKNYSITELEALAVLYGLVHFRHFVHGRPVTVKSDHHALCYLKNADQSTSRLTRWAIKLQEFDYQVIYKNGKAHTDADCLSRNPVLPAPEEESDLFDVPTFLLDNVDIRFEQQKDPGLQQLIQIIEDPENNESTIALRRKSKNFTLINGVLYKKNAIPSGNDNLLVVPHHLKHEILFAHHSEPLAGHLGIAKTFHRIKGRFYWDAMQSDVEKFVKGCADCQARKGEQHKKPAGLLKPIQVGLPFDRVAIDILGPFPKSKRGNVVIVVATDYATRWAETRAMANAKAESVAKFILEQILTRHGSPRYLLSDRGTNFRSQVVQELLKLMGVYHNFTTAYHPQCNGLTERFNKTLADMLAVFTSTSQKDWCQYLTHVTFAYNTARQDTTQFSPFMLVYAREAVLPTQANLLQEPLSSYVFDIREKALAVRNWAVENIYKKQNIDKERFDEKHRHVEFMPGEKIKIFTPIRKVGKSEKLLLKYFGPYTVIRKMGDVDYEIRKGSKKEVVHVSRLLKYNDPWSPQVSSDK